MKLLACKKVGKHQISLIKNEKLKSGKNAAISIHNIGEDIPERDICLETIFKTTKRFCAIIKLIDEGKINLCKTK